jgi:uncharacterized RDD family membrane protein YckC
MEEDPQQPLQSVPFYIIIARILIVSGMSFSAAAAVFFFVAGVWEVGLPALGVSLVFLILMFLVERAAA